MKSVGVAVLFVALVALTGCKGDQGVKGDQGPAGAPGATGASGETGATGPTGVFEGAASISAVVPDAVFVGRETWITVAGFSTQWASDPDVALNLMFCDGVTYNLADVIVASPTALVVPITVAATAQLGACEVKVTANGETLTLNDGFLLKSPLHPLVAAGTFKQGSIAIVQVQNLDFDNPFDSTRNNNGFYENITFAPSGGVGYIARDVEPYTMVVQVNMDVDATAGAKSFGFASGPAGGQVAFALPAAFTIEARTPVALLAGTPQSINVTEPMASALHVYTPPGGDGRVLVRVSSASTLSDPVMAILPASGKFADMLDLTNSFAWWTSGTAPYYIVSLDWSRETGTPYKLSAEADTETTNTTCATATALTANSLVTGLSLTDSDDADWFKITTAAGDVGKLLAIATVPGDPAVDTAIDVWAPVAGCPTDLSTPDYHSSNTPWHETLLIPVAAATTYYIRVSAAPEGYFLQSIYNLDVRLLVEPTTGADCAGADAITLPYASTTPFLLADAVDEDWFTFTTGASDAGKYVQIMTSPGTETPDPAISLYAGACGTDPTAGPVDVWFHDMLQWGPVENSHTYKVKISMGSANRAGLYNLSVKLITPAESANDTCAAPQTVTLPYTSTAPLSFSSADDQDWFKFTATAADVGKRVRVATSVEGLPVFTASNITVLQGSSCGTLNSLGATGAYGEADYLAPAPLYMAGDVYVRLTPMGPAGGAYYNLAISLE